MTENDALHTALKALEKISRTQYHIETPPVESLEEKMRRIADNAILEIKQARAAPQALPDVLTQEYGDSAQYVEDCNKCREVMAEMQAESEADRIIIEYHEATIKRLEAELKARGNK